MNRPPHRQEEDVSLACRSPISAQKSGREARDGSRKRKRRRIFTIAAVFAVAAIAAGVGLFNKSSEPAGPLPVHLPPSTASYLGVYAKGLQPRTPR